MNQLTIELSLVPEWDCIEHIRQAVELCIVAVFGEAPLKDAIAMAAAELLENAVKYGKRSAPVSISVKAVPEGVCVIVVNEVHDSNSALLLQERIAWLRSFEHPADAYRAALARAFEQDVEGGFGIVRVAFEGGCRVDCVTSEQRVEVSALHPLPNRRLPNLHGDLHV